MDPSTRVVKKTFANEQEIPQLLKDFLSDADRFLRSAADELGTEPLGSKSPLSEEALLHYAEEKLRAKGYGGGHNTKPQIHSRVAQFVREHMNSFVQEELSHAQEHFDMSEMRASLVEACCKSIMESSQYQVFKQEICSSVEQATQQFAHDYFNGPLERLENAESLSESVLEDSRWAFGAHENEVLITDGDTSSLSSSYGAACWDMMSLNRLTELAGRLDRRNSSEVRFEALRTLSSLPIAEVVTLDSWPRVRAQLEVALLVSSATLFESCLNFHAKMLRSTSSLCVTESYGILARVFHSMFEFGLHPSDQRSRVSHHPVSHVDLGEHHRLLQICKLINAFKRVVARYWARFPEQHVKVLIELTIKYLLDDTVNLADDLSSEELTPLHVLGLIDPHAVWFDAWMKGEFGRRLVIAEFRKHPMVLPHLVGKCLLNCEIISSCKEYVAPHSDRLNYNSLPHVYVEYCCLFQAINMLGLLLQSSSGRVLFDEQTDGIRSKEFANRLMRTVMDVSKMTDVCNEFCTAKAIVKAFAVLISQESGCQSIFSGNWLPNLVVELLRESEEAYAMTNCELHLLNHVADILFPLAGSVTGLQIILGKTNPIGPEEESFVRFLAAFTERLLLTSKDEFPSSCITLEDLKCKYVKICCHICASHDGVKVLKQTGLLHKIAEEWEALLVQGDHTPIPGAAKSNCFSKDKARDWLENLSAIGCTPLGLAALHKADLLHDVLNWAEKELQEGKQLNSLSLQNRLMLSQAAAACNIQLDLTHHVSPAVEFIAKVLYNSCELRCMFGTGTSLLPTPDERLEIFLTQMLADFACILPSCAAMTSLLPTTFSIVDTDGTPTIPNLVKLVVAGIQPAYCNTELICETGLRLLGILSTSLDTWLHLQSRYNLLEALLEVQQSNIIEGTSQLVIDSTFILRNCLLVKIAEIGGENEKILPPSVIEQEPPDMEFLRQWPLVVSLPISSNYLPSLSPLDFPPVEIDRFLKESQVENLDQDWIIYCREVFRNCLTDGKVQLRSEWFGDLLYHSVEAMAMKHERPALEGIPMKKAHAKAKLSNLFQVGSELVLRYGLRLGLLQNEVDIASRLEQVLVTFSSGIDLQEFDWITATIFLLMCGNEERTIRFRKQLQTFPIEALMTSCKALTISDLSSSSWLIFCHHIEVILLGDLPLVAHALQLSGISIGQICQPWISQCFWNILDWEEICSYFGLCLLCGKNFFVYYIVALFRHLQTEIVHHTKDGNAAIFLKETRLEGFCTRDYLPFMDHLESKYHDIVL